MFHSRSNPRPLAVLVVALFALASATCVADEQPATPAASTGDAAAPVAARVGDHTITLVEVDEAGRKSNAKLYQELYDTRRTTLDRMIAEYLIEQQAQAQGISSEQYLEQEVTAKLTPVSDEEVAAFYESNKARMGGGSLEQMSGQIQSYLKNNRGNEAFTALVQRLKADTGVEMALTPPRVEVTIAENDPRKGPDDAPVRIVEWSDFQCPYCARVGPTLKQIEAAYGDKVQIVFRDYPLPNHAQAQIAAEAGQCANVQGKFWEYHDKLFANQRALQKDQLKQYAVDLGLDGAAFNECLDSGRFTQAVTQDKNEGLKVGVSGTPALFINGRFVNGAQPFETLKPIIDEELANAGS